MIFSHEVSLKLPSSAIHLDDWLFNMSELEYQACAKGHRGIGSSKGGQFLGMINVESIGGNLILQHYETELLEPLHVRLFSTASRAYLMHVFPFYLKVTWEMAAIPLSESESQFRCTINVQNPAWARFLGAFIAANYWIRRHLVEETNGFARDLERKGGGRRASLV